MERQADNDNRSHLQRARDPARLLVEAWVADLLEGMTDEKIDPAIMREVLLDAAIRLLQANPYRHPVDIGTVKTDLCFLNDMHSRSSFLIEQLEKALNRSQG
ncbi:MAG: hypothetical protein KDC43_27465 [Saprospiraceae bacterium]|nr:hypothetical protein [Saprospiraceae bacterium]